MNKVLIVDDHQLVIDGRRFLLEYVLDIIFHGSVNSGEDFLDLHQKSPYDMVLLDIYMPGMDGLKYKENII